MSKTIKHENIEKEKKYNDMVFLLRFNQILEPFYSFSYLVHRLKKKKLPKPSFLLLCGVTATSSLEFFLGWSLSWSVVVIGHSANATNFMRAAAHSSQTQA